MSKNKAEDWQEEELRLVRAFLGQDVEPETRQHIKQLTLTKLSELPDKTEVPSEYLIRWPRVFGLDRILRLSRSFWWRWQWKLALPLALVLTLAGAGYGLNKSLSHAQHSTTQSALQVPDASLRYGSTAENSGSAPQTSSASGPSNLESQDNVKQADAKAVQTPKAAAEESKAASEGASTATQEASASIPGTSTVTPGAAADKAGAAMAMADAGTATPGAAAFLQGTATDTRTFSQKVSGRLGQVWPFMMPVAAIAGYVWWRKRTR